MSQDDKKESGPGKPEPGGTNSNAGKIVEQDPKDIPERSQSQVPDVNPHTVQKGHRDREQI